ncbi:hypothetical protein SLNWT_3433 [Streptomyces albus]|uniref:Uncharacterized protein n=2 Tax=Streptomyces TaxID=1883 RepID=A0A0B5EQD3_STRA4|nr:hypothetical protein SLNWT_3433 [Streptomyces albus]AOU78114.1 hypothetical protein SLNHY_3423 [Streptomyces albus]
MPPRLSVPVLLSDHRGERTVSAPLGARQAVPGQRPLPPRVRRRVGRGAQGDQFGGEPAARTVESGGIRGRYAEGALGVLAGAFGGVQRAREGAGGPPVGDEGRRGHAQGAEPVVAGDQRLGAEDEYQGAQARASGPPAFPASPHPRASVFPSLVPPSPHMRPPSPPHASAPAPGDTGGMAGQTGETGSGGRGRAEKAGKAVLDGGPAELDARVVEVAPESERDLKIRHRGGYEHFKATSRQEASSEGPLPVYEWWERTEIAE